MQPHERSLQCLAAEIQRTAYSSAGVLLRQLLWSIYSNRHVVCLWTMSERVKPAPKELAAHVIQSFLHGEIMPADLTRALLVSGEQRRYVRTWPSSEWQERFKAIESQIEELARVIPPCFAHTRAAKLLELFREVKDEIFDTEEAAADEPNF